VSSRLAVDATAARIGGGISRLNELTASFSALAPGSEYLLALGHDVPAPRVTPPRASYLRIPARWQSPAAAFVWKHAALPALLARWSPDWVLSPFNVLPLGPQLHRVRKAVIVSSIAPFHPDLIRTLSVKQRARVQILRELTWRSIAAADHVFLLSQEGERLLAGRLRGKRFSFLPMSPPPQTAVDQARRAELPPAARRGPYFLLPGDVWRYRGAHEAVRALLKLEQAGQEARLLVCGELLDPAYAVELRALAARSPGGRVCFLGSQPHVELLALMASSVATLTCSRVENTSRMPVEAMTMDAPVVAVNLPASWTSCGTGARYYEKDDVDGLAAAMQELLTSEASRQRRIEAGREQLARRDWTTATRLLLTTFGMLAD
jgi:glycosyltransferase involved in cell wall biosynthesis